MRNSAIVSLILLAAVPAIAHADDDVDVAAFEYVDVIETEEGSILRGVITEQTPKKYKLATADGSLHVIRAAHVVKITKQKNPRFRSVDAESVKPRTAATFASAAALPAVDEAELVATAKQPAPVKSGLRLSPEVAVVIPSGDLVAINGSPLSYRTSLGAGAAVAYEHYAGSVGLSVGGMLRYTSWQLPVQIAQLGAHSTIETHLFGRAALQLGRALPYAGVAIGADTNRTINHVNGVRTTAVGLGANLQAGVAIAASRAAVIDLGLDYHPGTDTIEPGLDASISYFALRLGATIRL